MGTEGLTFGSFKYMGVRTNEAEANKNISGIIAVNSYHKLMARLCYSIIIMKIMNVTMNSSHK